MKELNQLSGNDSSREWINWVMARPSISSVSQTQIYDCL